MAIRVQAGRVLVGRVHTVSGTPRPRAAARAALALAALGAVLGCGGSEDARTAPAPQSPAAPPAAAAVEAGPALAALLDEHWEYTLQRDPELASTVGDHRYDDRWTDNSPQAIAADLERTREFLGRFEALPREGLSEQDALSLQLMLHDLRETLDNARFERWLMPVNQLSGPHLDMPSLISQLRFADAKDYANYVARLRSLPRVLQNARELIRAGIAKKLVQPRQQLELTADQTEELGRGEPEQNPFFEPVQNFPDAVPEPERERIRGEVRAAIAELVLPAYREFAKFLREEYAPAGRSDAGMWSLPDGAARYAAQVKEMTTTSLTPAEIHEIGLREVTRIEGEQQEIGASLGFSELGAFREHIRSNPKLYSASREEILKRYERHTEQMYTELPRLFGRLPKQKMVVLPVEAFREKDAAGAEYWLGSPDGVRPGMVRVNTAGPTERLWIDMESTSYHEGVPGHHMQLTIQMELGELPQFRRFGGYTAFAEGWALYSERLGKEVGFFKDPYSDYGRLQDEMLRAIRLVVDTGVHEKRWTRDDMVKFFHDHSTIDEPSVQSETNRYIVWPGQALAYKVGQLTILRLREQAAARLGARFDVREFHDRVLGAGALPLDMLEQRIGSWLDSAAAG